MNNIQDHDLYQLNFWDIDFLSKQEQTDTWYNSYFPILFVVQTRYPKILIILDI